MRPPLCAVCKAKFIREIEKGGLVSFQLSETDKQYNARFKKPGFVGHPRGKYWFCKDHIKDAKQLTKLSAQEAIAQLKEKYNFLKVTKKPRLHTYRNKGALGALLDEYARAISDLFSVIKNISNEELGAIVDPDTKDENCRSIQTIMSHVVRSGYCYCIYLQNHLGAEHEFPAIELLPSVKAYKAALKKMFAYNLEFFSQNPTLQLEVKETEKKILTNWGQRYDPDQLMEHAIVHVLRHRRQIERFLLKLRE